MDTSPRGHNWRYARDVTTTQDLGGYFDLTTTVVGPMSNNAYLLRCTRTGDQVLIDAADEPARLLEAIGTAGLTKVVTTHRHGDHWQALEEIVTSTGAETVAGTPDADELPVTVDTRVWTGDTIAVGDWHLDVIGLVGHTPGSIALVFTPKEGTSHVFSGDSLFPGGVGKTWSEADFATLIDEVEQKIFGAYGDDTVVHPGHGDSTTLGAERPHLAEWRARGW